MRRRRAGGGSSGERRGAKAVGENKAKGNRAVEADTAGGGDTVVDEDLRAPGRVWPWVCAVVVAAGGVVLALTQYQIRPLEAWLSAVILDSFRVADAQPLGTAVVFPMDDVFVGFSVTAGCTAALLVSPFGVLAGGLIGARRTTVRRGLATLGMLAAILFAVNQARFFVIVLSMRLWGFERGYEVSHVLLGTVVSTLGVLLGLLLFVRMLLGQRIAGAVGG